MRPAPAHMHSRAPGTAGTASTRHRQKHPLPPSLCSIPPTHRAYVLAVTCFAARSTRGCPMQYNTVPDGTTLETCSATHACCLPCAACRCVHVCKQGQAHNNIGVHQCAPGKCPHANWQSLSHDSANNQHHTSHSASNSNAKSTAQYARNSAISQNLWLLVQCQSNSSSHLVCCHAY